MGEPHYDVRVLPYPGDETGWFVTIDGLERVTEYPIATKAEAERTGGAVAEAIAVVTGGSAELYIHNEDGRFEAGDSRRTFPRSADPEGSRG